MHKRDLQVVNKAAVRPVSSFFFCIRELSLSVTKNYPLWKLIWGEGGGEGGRQRERDRQTWEGSWRGRLENITLWTWHALCANTLTVAVVSSARVGCSGNPERVKP